MTTEDVFVQMRLQRTATFFCLVALVISALTYDVTNSRAKFFWRIKLCSISTTIQQTRIWHEQLHHC